MNRPVQVAVAGMLGAGLLAACGAGLLAPHALAARVLHAAVALRAHGLPGALLFGGLIASGAMVGVVPGGLLGLAAGAVYGIGWGFVISAIGILFAALGAFGLGRSIARPLVAAALGRRARLRALDDLVSWRIVFLLRVSPVMPFSLTSYALGLSRIGFADYLIGTLAALPPLAGYVAIGAFGHATLAAQGGPIREALFAVGAAASLALILHLSRGLKRLAAQTAAGAR